MKIGMLCMMVASLSVGCAVEETEADVGEEDLTSLSPSDVVGSVRLDMEAQIVSAPANTTGRISYRAVKLDALQGEEIVARVSTSNGSDPIAFLLDSSFKTLKYNDNALSGFKDSEIRTKLPKSGVYYIAFRTKERAATTFAISVRPPSEAKTKSYADGWGRPWVSGAQETKYQVLVRGEGTMNESWDRDRCPTATLVKADGTLAGRPSAQTITFTVDLAARTIRTDAYLVGAGAPIKADGSFTMESSSYGQVGVRGRVAPGGVVVVEEAITRVCHRQSDGYLQRATLVRNGIGVIRTN